MGDGVAAYWPDGESVIIPSSSRLRSPRPLTVPESPADLPSWMSGKAVNEWVAVPNSQFAYNIDYSYFVTDMGLPNPTTRPAPYTNQITMGTNKYGLTYPNSAENRGIAASGGLCSYSGVAFDDRFTRVFRGAGDAQRVDAAVHRLTIHDDNPYITSAIVKPCHHLNVRMPIHPSTNSYPAELPGDDTRWDRMYDGSHRGGHPYFQKQFIKGEIGSTGLVDSFCMFGNKQWFPIDEGGSADVHVASLSDGLWRPDFVTPTIPAVPNWQSDELAWFQKHPTTENIYSWGGNTNFHILSRWNRVTNTWTELLYIAATLGMARGSGSIDWSNDYLLFSSCLSNFTTRHVWMTDLTTPAKVNVTLTGPYADSFNPYRGGGLCWCPDLGKHLWYNDSGWVMTLERTGASTFYVDLLSMTGVGPAAGQAQANKADNQMYSSLQYSPEMQCMVLFISDMDPVYVWRTA